MKSNSQPCGKALVHIRPHPREPGSDLDFKEAAHPLFFAGFLECLEVGTSHLNLHSLCADVGHLEEPMARSVSPWTLDRELNLNPRMLSFIR